MVRPAIAVLVVTLCFAVPMAARTQAKPKSRLATRRAKLLAGVSECARAHALAGETKPKSPLVDVARGYARIAGAYPTCGCHCEQTAAFFHAKGRGVVLGYYEESCGFESALKGPWDRVLPKGFRRAFGEGLESYKGEAVFSVHALLPRHGTTVQLSLRPLALGMDMRCPSGICTARGNERAKSTQALSRKQAAGVAARRYELFKKITHDRILLRWNRALGRFEVERRLRKKMLSLREFFESCQIWAALC